MRNTKTLGYLLGAFSIIVWGVTFVSTKALLTDFSALEILLFRFVAAYVALWIIRPKVEKIPFKENIIFMLAGLSGVVVYQFAENTAISYTSCSNVSIIVSLCPMLTAVIAQIFLKEKHITPWFVIGFVIAITGVAMVTLNGYGTLEFNPKGDFLAFFAAVCWGFYSLCVSVINRHKYDSICSTRRIFFYALIFMIPWVLFGTKASPDSPSYFTFNADTNISRFSSLTNIFNTLFLGVVASALCFCAWNKACNIIGTVRISAGIYLIPVVTILFAHIFLGENLSLMGGVGAVLVIAGLFLSGRKKNQ